MTRDILVTGALGFMGAHVVKGLLSTEHSVTILTRGKKAIPAEWAGSVKVAVGDLTDKGSLVRAAEGINLVHHLAGEINDKDACYAVNALGTQNLLEACQAQGVAKVVHYSSVGVMGPQQGGVVDEAAPCRPVGAYERSKYQGEQIALRFHGEGKIRVAVLRPTNVFGEGWKGGVDSFARWLRMIGRGRFRRVGGRPAVANFIYVGDVVEACLRVAENGEADGQVYIVADPCPMDDFVDMMAEAMGVTVPRWRVPRAAAYAAAAGMQVLGGALGFSSPLTVDRVKAVTLGCLYSPQRIQRELGFRPPIGLREGLRRTVEWYRANGILPALAGRP